MTAVIQNKDVKVTVSSLGAEVISVVCGGAERVWQNGNGEWSGHAPVLFPYCGNCKVMLGGIAYKGAAHGFARKSEFTLCSKSETSVKFKLESSPVTKAYYPFDFTFLVEYVLRGSTLEVSYTAVNPSERELPFSCGGHESFALSRDVGEYCIKFDKREKLVHYFHNDDGLLDGRTHDYGETDTFMLPADFLTEGKTLIFPHIKSRKVTLCDGGGNTVAVSEFADFEHLLLWRPHGGRTICIEPWGNLPVGSADFKTLAPFCVKPKSEFTVTRKIAYGAAY